MATKKVQLTELTEASVQFVSLVDRSSSRIPFRALKSDKENSMGINLANLGRVLKGEKLPAKDLSPTVVGIVTFDHGPEVMPAVMLALKAEGFSVDTVVKNEDGTLMFTQVEGGDTTGTTVIKMSDELALVVKGFDPYSYGLGKDTTFDEHAKTQGFWGSLYNASDVLRSRVSDSLATCTTKAEGVAAVKSAMGEYQQYVVALAGALPEKAFKADVGVNGAITASCIAKAELSKAEKAKAEAEAAAAKAKAEEGGEKPAEEKAEGKTGEAKEVKKDEVVVEALAIVAATEVPAVEVVAKVDAPALAVAAEGTVQKSDMEKMMEAIAGLGETVQAMVSKVDTLSGDMKTVVEKQATTEQKVDEAVKKADTTSNAVKNTILAAPASGEDTPAAEGEKVVTKKADPRTGNFDTAFLSGSRRNR